MLKNLYDYVLKLATHRHAEFWLFTVAFVESSFFPIPPDVILIPMIMVAFHNAFRYAFVCTVGSVLGGIVGYAIGSGFEETLGQAIISFYGAQEYYAIMQEWYNEQLILIVGAAGFSPIPYKIFTILSGMMHADFATFTMASIVSRGARFFLVAWLLWRGGPRLKIWIEENFYPLTMVVTVVLVIAVVIFKVIL